MFNFYRSRASPESFSSVSGDFQQTITLKTQKSEHREKITATCQEDFIRFSEQAWFAYLLFAFLNCGSEVHFETTDGTGGTDEIEEFKHPRFFYTFRVTELDWMLIESILDQLHPLVELREFCLSLPGILDKSTRSQNQHIRHGLRTDPKGTMNSLLRIHLGKTFEIESWKWDQGHVLFRPRIFWLHPVLNFKIEDFVASSEFEAIAHSTGQGNFFQLQTDPRAVHQQFTITLQHPRFQLEGRVVAPSESLSQGVEDAWDIVLRIKQELQLPGKVRISTQYNQDKPTVRKNRGNVFFHISPADEIFLS